MVDVDISKQLTRGEVSKRLGISPERVAELSREGRIKFMKTPLGRLYDPDEIERLKREREESKHGCAAQQRK